VSSDLTVDTNTLFVDASTDKVGINTTSPQKTFVVSNGGAEGFEISPTDVSATIRQIAYNRSTSSHLAFRYGALQHEFHVSDQEKMRIDSSGNVLVGKTSSSDSAGIELLANGTIDLQASNSLLAYFNRTGSDGTIMEFHRSGVVKGLISSRSGFIDIGNDDAGLRFEGSNNAINPRNPTTGDNSDNSLDLGKSASRFKDLYLGGGLYVGGTGSANKLDDYEEGTWSPNITTGTADFYNALYTKIGRQVTLTFNIENLSDDTSSSAMIIGNLPFTNIGGFEFAGSCHGERVSSTFRALVPFLAQGDNTIGYRVPGGTTNFERLFHSDVNDGADFAMRTQIVYFTN
jgi:hypothetical protein